MRKILLIPICTLLISCGSTKKISFHTDTFMSSGIKEKFEIVVPRDYTKATSDLKSNLLKNWMYADDSFIYISLDLSFTDSPNVSNWVKCSDVSKKSKCTEGIDDKGNYWKEEVKNNLVIGYKNVSFNRKSEFDNSLVSFEKVSNVSN